MAKQLLSVQFQVVIAQLYDRNKRKRERNANYPQLSHRTANTPDRRAQPFLHSADVAAPHTSFMQLLDSITYFSAQPAKISPKQFESYKTNP